jgi:general secretion pathway protein K
MIWQQWRAVAVETAERARIQSAWIIAGAIDWARLILREDARSSRPTALTEPWAQALPETRLSTFLAADKSRVEDAPDAFLSGSIVDAQSRYNLLNLVDAGKIVPAEQATLQRLADSLGVAAGTAERIAAGVRDALAAPAGDDADTAPLLPRSVGQLGWFGVDAESIARLRDYVAILPVRTPVNVNTASREVIAAVIEGLDLASAERITRERQGSPFRDLEAVRRLLPGATTLDSRRLATVSSYFEVRGRLRLDDWAVEELVLMQRRGLDVVPVWRERVNQLEGGR